MRADCRVARRLGPWLPLCLAAAISTETLVCAQTPVAVAGDQPVAPDLRHRGHHDEGPPLTLDAALSEALQRNPDLASLRHALDAARQRPTQERSLSPPMLEAQIWQWPIDTINPADTTMYMITATQEIPGRGKRALRSAVVETDAAIAESAIAMRARAIVDEVKQAYAELWLARTAIDSHLASVDLLRQFADVSTAKYETGRIAQQDVLKAIVEISKLHEDLVMLDERAGLAEARLDTLLDRPPDAAIGALAEPRDPGRLPAVADLQRLALDRQPELRTARLEIARAEAARAVVVGESRPDFFVSGGYMLMPRDRDAWTGSIGITWPTAPWARGKLDAKRAEADADIEAARARLHAAENRVRLAVQAAYVRVQAAQQRVALLRTTVIPQSQQTLDVSRVAYQTDRVDFLALIDNQRTLLDARLAGDRARSDLEQALADLEHAVGVDLTRPDVSAAMAIETPTRITTTTPRSER